MTARNTASTITEYHTICAQAIGRLLASIKKTAIEAEDSHDSAPSSPSTHGTQIGRYTNATHWKDGISASIYRALDPSTNLTVALKVTTPALMTAPHDSVREARILTASKHPNIIPLLEAFQHQERFTLAFPFIPYDLSTLLHKSLSPSTQRLILHSLFSALSHLHTLSIIHRDIKPSNILLPSLDGPAYLADFGTAHSPLESSEPPLQKHTEVGTTSYRPPELLFGKRDYGCKLDMWSAGCVAAQVLGLGVKTLFDSGDLGSELALVKSVFEQLGTPDEERWPEAKSLPDWGKMRFTKYPGKSWEELLPDVSEEGMDLVSRLVVFESGDRLSADEALRHPYFAQTV